MPALSSIFLSRAISPGFGELRIIFITYSIPMFSVRSITDCHLASQKTNAPPPPESNGKLDADSGRCTRGPGAAINSSSCVLLVFCGQFLSSFRSWHSTALAHLRCTVAGGCSEDRLIRRSGHADLAERERRARPMAKRRGTTNTMRAGSLSSRCRTGSRGTGDQGRRSVLPNPLSRIRCDTEATRRRSARRRIPQQCSGHRGSALRGNPLRAIVAT